MTSRGRKREREEQQAASKASNEDAPPSETSGAGETVSRVTPPTGGSGAKRRAAEPEAHPSPTQDAAFMLHASDMKSRLSDVSFQQNVPYHLLDGESLTPAELMDIGTGGVSVDLTETAWGRVAAGRQVIQHAVDSKEVVYGVNTGFGNFATVVIEPEKLRDLQVNLIRSHAAGTGELLSREQTRMLLAVRINVLAKGHSGARPETVRHMLDALNKDCLSAVPSQGTVGASGDLAPLAHLALGLIGEGEMWDPTRKVYRKAADVLAAHKLTPIDLEAKEGLALINGTQMISTIGCQALTRAESLCRQADVVAALTLEVLRGTGKAFDPAIHAARPHRGQIDVASRMRGLLQSDFRPSEIAQSHVGCNKVQDSYTLRCIPQVHGIVNDTVDFVSGILTTELNSATDNPMVFASTGRLLSGGNFHGEYPAKACDYLAIGVSELASISERRIERLCNPTLSELPAFLVKDGGLNSGFMIAHCTAAALVSENKTLCHPSSVDSISTSAAKEDHVSMGGWSARKALRVVEHVETVLAIELLAACQGLEFLRPLKTAATLEAVHKLVREHVAPWDKDRIMAPDISAAKELLRSGAIWRAVSPHMKAYGYKLRVSEPQTNWK